MYHRVTLESEDHPDRMGHSEISELKDHEEHPENQGSLEML